MESPIASILLFGRGEALVRTERAYRRLEIALVPPPPPKVTVMNPVKQDVTRYFDTTGNTVAMNSAPPRLARS
jgi:hypothetical protein